MLSQSTLEVCHLVFKQVFLSLNRSKDISYPRNWTPGIPASRSGTSGDYENSWNVTFVCITTWIVLQLTFFLIYFSSVTWRGLVLLDRSLFKIQSGHHLFCSDGVSILFLSVFPDSYGRAVRVSWYPKVQRSWWCSSRFTGSLWPHLSLLLFLLTSQGKCCISSLLQFGHERHLITVLLVINS